MELNWLIVFHLQFGKTLQYCYNSDRINEGTESLRRVIIKPSIDWFELWVIKGTHMSTLYKHVRDVQAFAEVVSLFVWNDVKQFTRNVDNSRLWMRFFRLWSTTSFSKMFLNVVRRLLFIYFICLHLQI